MSCVCENLSAGISKECDNNIGGIKKMYITEKCNIVSYTLSSPGDEISAISMTGSTLFYDFEFTKNSSFFEESTTANPENGTELTTQTITLKLNRREKTKRDILMLLGKFKDLVIIITDNNDVNWLFGETSGCNLSTNVSTSGTAKTDANGYTLTFIGEEPEPANSVTDAALALAIT